MSDDHAEARRRAGKRLLGGLLVAGGGMIALLCGACTLYLGGVILIAGLQTPATLTAIIVPLIVGGLPTAVGAILFWIGLRLWREGGAPAGRPWKEFE